MKRTFYYKERNRQVKLFTDGFFGDAQNGGHWTIFDKAGNKTGVATDFDFILCPRDSTINLYSKIRQASQKYFSCHDISWWRQEEDGYCPTGHLLSSQIHCLNHLLALRKDDIAIKAIIENATGLKIKEVYPAPFDKDGGFISFEFVCKNKSLLNEKYETRGANCTSIDALVYIQTTDGRKLLIPIEWKYTETYQGKEAEESSLERYPKLIDEKSNLKAWADLYKADPYYELMRQTLLMEQIIAKHEVSNIEATDYMHIMVIPKEHSELRTAIEGNYIPTLKDPSKFKIIDPQELLSPLKGNDDYKELLNYLETRYW